MKQIALKINRKKDADLTVAKQLITRLSAFSCRILLAEEWTGRLCGENLSFVPEEAFYTASDCIITLGGDGTILSIAAKAAQNNIPILGINLGTVGFMAELELRDIAQIDRLFSGEYIVSERMMLQILVNGKDELLALNECCISENRGFHIVELSLSADGKKVCDFQADGLIFNTPTGSTGYSFSAGGAVIDSGFDCIGVKPICSYLLINSHHMIFRPETEFRVKSLSSPAHKIIVCADGREERTLDVGDEITIRRAPYRAKLIQLSEKSNFDVFFKKF